MNQVIAVNAVLFIELILKFQFVIVLVGRSDKIAEFIEIQRTSYDRFGTASILR